MEAIEEELQVARNEANNNESKYHQEMKLLQEKHEREKQDMQIKIVRALDEVKDLNSQITKM